MNALQLSRQGKCRQCRKPLTKKTTWGWLCRECRNVNQRASAKKRRERGLTSGGTMPRSWWAKYRQRPEVNMKNIARSKVQGALKTGFLVKSPCRDCGDSNSEAHHPDYSKPLEVIWLCKSHHVAEHKRIAILSKAGQ